ncbi:MAG: amidohydrolase [Planctomycetes bacterium]|nr:amidohydrolase [Planctomycetota bacterium]
MTLVAAGCVVPPADLVILRGDIVTMDPDIPDSEALCVVKDRIVYVGSNREAERYIDRKKTRVLKLNGEMVIPAFIEGHGHLLSLGKSRRMVSLFGARSEEECIERTRKYIQDNKIPPNKWVTGKGWDQNDWPGKSFPTHQNLSAAIPGHPVALFRVDQHALWVNRKVLQIANITEKISPMSGGEIIRDAAGLPTGVLVDQAMDLVNLPRDSNEELLMDFEWAQQLCFQNGIVSFQDAGTSIQHIDLFQRWIDQGRFKLRLYVMVIDEFDQLFRRIPALGLGESHLTVRAVKLIADGALGSRGAWLLEDYSDRPGYRGFPLLNRQQVEQTLSAATAAGYQVCVHAIGDAANRMVLDALENHQANNPNLEPLRFRIEHAQVIDQADFDRLAKNQVIASIQGVHATSDMPWAEDRIGKERALEGAYAYKTLVEKGIRILNGTDAPVEDLSPLRCFYALVTRKDPSGNPPSGWHPEQRLSREEALRAYTIAAAYGSFEEELKGSLTPGKLADIAILSRNILICPEKEILDAKVLYTFAAGEEVYKAPSVQP